MIHRYALRCILLLSLAPSVATQLAQCQEWSIARRWNEELLFAIKKDFARPPMQARNLFHVSAVMYDAWWAYGNKGDAWLLGKTRGGYTCPYNGVVIPNDVEAARAEAISFATYRMIAHRYQLSPGYALTMTNMNALMDSLGYDVGNTSTDYVNGGPAELGNYIAEQMIAFGLQDGSNEAGNYAYQYYAPVNPSLHVEDPGNPTMVDPNRWQEVTLTVSIDQQGNPVEATRPFIGPEWGNVVPFAMDAADITEYSRDGDLYKVYHDPGPPAYLDTLDPAGLESFYKWNHTLVPVWQSHLDPNDDTIWDISPASIGNNQWLPTTPAEFDQFYDFINGGDNSPGHAVNPVTGQPYEPQLVKRGDYARVLAEFWADGPNSETPPGHWYSILHTVTEHPLFERKWMGQGEPLDALEYDVKSHLALGGSLHDAAITAWSIKGWYDYVRPVSAVRYMADRGQCTSPALQNYHPAGIPLIPGLVELVGSGDPLAGPNDEHVGKIKLFTWKGPDYITTPATDYAGVDWILAENWFPYQRPTFVTPPFAGYISGHSTYSRTAAELMTLMTGSPYFPGGMSNFTCSQNEFLVFEEGPSEDIVLQWATYRDASDQCSLSRIWGGIHPPVDDIPGRVLGQVIGPDAFNGADALYSTERPQIVGISVTDPSLNIDDISLATTVTLTYDMPMNTLVAPTILFPVDDPITAGALLVQTAEWTSDTTYVIGYKLQDMEIEHHDIFMRVAGGLSASDGNEQHVQLFAQPFIIDTRRPGLAGIAPSTTIINDASVAQGEWSLTITFDEPMDMGQVPELLYIAVPDPSASLLPDLLNSAWLDDRNYLARILMTDNYEEIESIEVQVVSAMDAAANTMVAQSQADVFAIDTREPQLLSVDISDASLALMDVGQGALAVTLTFDQPMDILGDPSLSYSSDDPTVSSLVLDPSESGWQDDVTHRTTYDLLNANEELFDIDVMLNEFRDPSGNTPSTMVLENAFLLDTHRPTVTASTPSVTMVADAQAINDDLYVDIAFPEPMDIGQPPLIEVIGDAGMGNTFDYDLFGSNWLDANTFRARLNVTDIGVEVSGIGIDVSFAEDVAGNVQLPASISDILDLDTRNPQVLLATANTYDVTNSDMGANGLLILSVFDEPMLASSAPIATFNATSSLDGILTPNTGGSNWLNASTYQNAFDVGNVDASIEGIDVLLSSARDGAGNLMVPIAQEDLLSVMLTYVGIAEIAGNALPGMIHPNPVIAGDVLFVSLDRPMDLEVVRLLGANGQVVFETGSPGSIVERMQLNIPHVASGLYTLQVQIEGKLHHARLAIMTR